MSPGAKALTSGAMAATIDEPMMGASRSPIKGRVWSRLMMGEASVPTSGMAVRNWSNCVTSLTRTPKVWVPLAPPSSQLAYGRTVKLCGLVVSGPFGTVPILILPPMSPSPQLLPQVPPRIV